MITIDVCEEFSGAGCLKQYYKSKEISDYTIYTLWMGLSIGDIKMNHLEFFKKFCHDSNYNYIDSLNELLNNINNDTKIRIWSSKKNDDDYMLLLFLCNFLKDKTNKISVVFSSDYDGVCSINALDYKEIESVLKYEKLLSEEEILLFSNQWNNLVEINSELRVFNGEKVENKKYADYYDTILNILKENSVCTIANLIGDCIVKRVINDAGDLLYLFLIDQMIELNMIKIIEKGARHFVDVIALN